MSRLAPYFAIGASIACVLAAVVHVALRDPADLPTARGSAAIRPGVPVAQSAAAVRRLERSVAAYTRDCTPLPLPASFEYPATLDATARITCFATGTGASSLQAFQFPDAARAKAMLGDWLDFLPQAIGPCDAARGYIRWNDRRNRVRGSILCGASPDGTAYVVWSDEPAGSAFVAQGTNLVETLGWWSAHMRPQAKFPTPAEKRLLDHVKKSVKASECRRDSTGGSPMSVASIECNDADAASGRTLPLDYLFYERFASQADLDRHFRAVIALNAPAASNDPKAYCNAASTEVDAWYRGLSPRGSLACWWDSVGRQMAWTTDEGHDYGQLAIRRTTMTAASAWWLLVSRP